MNKLKAFGVLLIIGGLLVLVGAITMNSPEGSSFHALHSHLKNFLKNTGQPREFWMFISILITLAGGGILFREASG